MTDSIGMQTALAAGTWAFCGGGAMFEEEVRRRIHFAPEPDWVEVQPFARPEKLDASRAPHGFFTWLMDDQSRLDPRPQRYNRTIEEVVNLSALQWLANVTLPFDPWYDDLTIHHIRILRGDEVIEVDVARRYLVMRRESSFERLVLDGRWTLAVTLPDVRVGDIIDMALTLSGDPACFQSEFSVPLLLQNVVYWHRRHARLLVPPDRQLYMKPFPAGWREPHISVLADGYSDIRFEANHVEACDYEPDMPGWVMPMRGVFASSTDSWARVNEVMRAGFEGDEDYPDGLLQVIAQIKADHTETPDRIMAAVRWVQEHIRYFAFSFGEGGFVPRPLRQIFADRIGDCKDVSKLIAAMLTRMGVEAWPALVDTQRGFDLLHTQPRLGAFNHCIAMCVHAGKTYWFEGTSSVAQGGDLDHLAQTDLGYALILKPGADLARMMAKTPQLNYEVREQIHLPEKTGEGTLIEIDYIYRGARADAVRRALRYQSLTSYIEDRCALFSYIYGMNMCAIPQMVDDRRINEITITTVVTTDTPWHATDGRGGKVFFSPESAFDYVLSEPDSQRRFPFDLGDVRQGRVTTTLRTPLHLSWPDAVKSWDFGGLHLSFTARRTQAGYEAVRDYTVTRPWLWAQEKNALDQAHAELSACDRLSLHVPSNLPARWLPGFLLRIGLWGGLPVVGLIIWRIHAVLTP
ncbi:DUF3857 domain-containing protein [Asticcacaulis sp. EMRT-3]|uniref:DUF3857 domain-containing protein n=1 Tax=Asticcacaulis sp. EMRT-3 TaxID=3040349 RepID=UPI0024AF0C36|nr:DUF3857 domain-containing protein [Asticcacaulis sp. EMRT-3]MDI7774600.1 DUF3857 domain-containing protein [Asticcacaulis sp. EMRT-3]